MRGDPRWRLRLRLLRKTKTDDLDEKELIAVKILAIGMRHKKQLGIHAAHGGQVAKSSGSPAGRNAYGGIPKPLNPVGDNRYRELFIPLPKQTRSSWRKIGEMGSEIGDRLRKSWSNVSRGLK